MPSKARSAVAVACACLAALAVASPGAEAQRINFPVVYDTLPNGLKVVLSPDSSAPIVTVAVYYHIGFRIEPRNRTGFAHLFEHLMFQGSKNLGKMQFVKLIQANGGILNGSTRFDFTNYFEIVPSNTLQTMLWAEADRMSGLDMPQVANTNWYNAHNFYGDLADIDAATLEDARSFFHTYYTPNNAVLVVVGDFDPQQAMKWITQYFGGIASVERPAMPDISEPRQTAEKRVTHEDPLAPRPALAIAYHIPPRETPEYYAMGVIDQILLQGKDSRLYQALVQRTGLTGDVSGGINLLGNMYDYQGPMLWMASLIHDKDKSADSILAVIDSAIAPLSTTPVDQATLDRAIVKMRSDLYDTLGGMFGFGRADLLASYALFDGDPGHINEMEDELRKVTPELIQKTAREYLRSTNRTVLLIEPKPGATPAEPTTEPRSNQGRGS